MSSSSRFCGNELVGRVKLKLCRGWCIIFNYLEEPSFHAHVLESCPSLGQLKLHCFPTPFRLLPLPYFGAMSHVPATSEFGLNYLELLRLLFLIVLSLAQMCYVVHTYRFE